MISVMAVTKGREPFPFVAASLAVACAAVASVEVFAMANGTGRKLGVALFVLWNCTPLLVAFKIAVATRTCRTSVRRAGYSFAAGAAGAVVFAHIMWAFDVGAIATSSSTSGLLFVFLPVYGAACGLALAAATGPIGHLVYLSRGRAPS